MTRLALGAGGRRLRTILTAWPSCSASAWSPRRSRSPAPDQRRRLAVGRRLRRHRRGRHRADRVQDRQRGRLHRPAADARRVAARAGARRPQVGAAVGDVSGEARWSARRQARRRGPYFGVGYDSRTPGAAKLTAFRLHVRPLGDRSGRGRRSTSETLAKRALRARRRRSRSPPTAPRRRSASSASRASARSSRSARRRSPCSTCARRSRCSTSRAATTGARRRQPGTAPPDVRARRRRRGRPAATRSSPPQAQDRFTLDGLKQFVGIIKIVLLVFGGVAIFVGAFTIFNTLSITVAQRTRELAMLRTVGASRRQVLGSVLLEALALGTARRSSASRAGFGLATGINAAVRALGLDLPEAGTVFERAGRDRRAARRHGVTAGRRLPAGAAGDAHRPGAGAARRRSGPRASRASPAAACGRSASVSAARPSASAASAGGLARRNTMRHPGRTAATACRADDRRDAGDRGDRRRGRSRAGTTGARSTTASPAST